MAGKKKPGKKTHSLKRLSLLPRQRIKRPSSPEEAKVWLREVARTLYRQPNASNQLRFVARAIRVFLMGKGKISLDAAFGLTSKRGAPGWPEVRFAMAEEIHRMRPAGSSWKDIAKALEKKGYKDTDTGTLRRIYREFQTVLTSDELWKSLDLLDKNGST